jgi:hypothetical protein
MVNLVAGSEAQDLPIACYFGDAKFLFKVAFHLFLLHF